jgi:hypothetical protein
MNKDERVNHLLELREKLNGLENTKDCAFWLYGTDEYDIVVCGDMQMLCNVFINLMEDDDDLRHVISEAVYALDGANSDDEQGDDMFDFREN